MTSILPLLRKAWEKEECFMTHELGFIAHVIRGHCIDGRGLVSRYLCPHLMIEVFRLVYWIYMAVFL